MQKPDNGNCECSVMLSLSLSRPWRCRFHLSLSSSSSFCRAHLLRRHWLQFLLFFSSKFSFSFSFFSTKKSRKSNASHGMTVDFGAKKRGVWRRKWHLHFSEWIPPTNPKKNGILEGEREKKKDSRQCCCSSLSLFQKGIRWKWLSGEEDIDFFFSFTRFGHRCGVSLMEELNFRWEEDFPPEMLEHAWTCMFERDVLQREKAKAQALTLLNKEVGGGVWLEERKSWNRGFGLRDAWKESL